ncbi:hypothetical protein Bca52824_016669 [Brassica carinata]|uniref:Uncharacterized protein n=1 Tax=Brassica carinata TaxID=52824 RepID=A0A8X7W5I5_BRACI|nr:hypothetical protein Bca52824_016669 [Brassica carinata]
MRGAKATSLTPTLTTLLTIKHLKPGCEGSSLEEGGRVSVLKRKGDLLTKQPTDSLITGMEESLSTPSQGNLWTPKTLKANKAPHVLLTLRTIEGSFLYLIKRGQPEIDRVHAQKQNYKLDTIYRPKSALRAEEGHSLAKAKEKELTTTTPLQHQITPDLSWKSLSTSPRASKAGHRPTNKEIHCTARPTQKSDSYLFPVSRNLVETPGLHDIERNHLRNSRSGEPKDNRRF